MGLFSKKNKESSGEDGSQGFDSSSLADFAPPPPTSPVAEEKPKSVELGSKNVPTTKVEDEKASYEIPDFSESDLDFDLDLDEFESGKKPAVPVAKQAKSEVHEEFKQPSPGVIEEQTPVVDAVAGDEDLPSFEIGGGFDLQRVVEDTDKPDVKVVAPVVPVEKKAAQKRLPVPQDDVFIRKQEYMELLAREEEVLADNKRAQEAALAVLAIEDKGEALTKAISGVLDETKHRLLELDSMLFGD